MKFHLCLFFIHVMFRGTDGIRLPKSLGVLSEERTSISITDTKWSGSSRHRRATRNNALPQSLSLQININGSPVRLDLIQNTQISKDVPAYVFDDNKMFIHQTGNINEISSFYYDVSRGASVYIKCTEERKEDKKQCQKFEFFGCFATNQGQYVIEPLSTKSDVHDIPPGEVRATQYRLVKLAESFDLHSNIQVDPSTLRYEKQSTNHRRQKRDTAYNVELLMVTDFSVYSYWMNEYENETLAVDMLKTFYAFMFNGIQARYNNIDANILNIKIVFAGLIISRNSTDSPWTENIKVLKNGQYTVSAMDARYQFRLWIIAKTSTIPGHDHAMAFTRYDLRYGSDDSQGLGFDNGICTSNGQSIVQSEFNFITHTVAAHKLAHNLGASHNGYNDNCTQETHNIMSLVNKAVDGSLNSQAPYVLNPWIFTSCAVNGMRIFLNNLANSYCLRNKDVWDNVTDLAPHLELKLGVFYDVNLQCMKAMGTGSVMCIGKYNNNYSTICTGLWCSDPFYGNPCTLIIPAIGTTCGDKKWCVNGRCVSDELAPDVTRLDCMYGDELTLNCSTSVGEDPSKCYGSTANTCCDTCSRHSTGIKDCQYGDRTPDCKSQDCWLYPSYLLNQCCQTCKSFLSMANDSTTGSGSSQPNWVIPVAAGGGGGLLLLAVIIVALYCFCRKGSGDEKDPRIMGPPLHNHNGKRPLPSISGRRGVSEDEGYIYFSTGYIEPFRVQEPNESRGIGPLSPISQPQSNVLQRGASINSNNVYVEIQDPHEYQELPDARPSGSEYQKLKTRKPSGTYTKLQPNTQLYVNRGFSN